MIKQFENLAMEEQELLLKAPVLVSVLASCSFNNVNEIQKADAIKLAHLKTFTATPLLLPYYEVVEKDFEQQFDTVVKKYFPFDEPKRKALKNEVERVNTVMMKLDRDYADTLHKSLDQYASHVKKSTHTVFMDFIFPISSPWRNG